MSAGQKEKRIYIFDTTLRDGEQSPGASMSIDDKLKVARQLSKLKVDTIEAGFPVSSPVQFEAVKVIAQTIKGPVITGLARAVKKDIDACYNATKYSTRPGIHTFIATSDIHLKHKFGITRERALEMAVEAVKYARKKVEHVEFSAEDATRTDWAYLAEVVRAVIRAGAQVVNLPDTVGYTIPSEYQALLSYISEKVPESRRVRLSVHCHNDLGLATANSLAAIEGGATQVEVAVNGIGERAGNAALEEVVMGIQTRKDYLNSVCKINTTEIYNASRLVQSITGIHVQPNKAVVGANAFSHEAGIHQHGMLKNSKTYEIMEPKKIGIPSSRLILGRHSGMHGFTRRMEELGLKLGKKEMEKAFARFLEVADKKREVYDEDLFAIVSEIKNIAPSRNAWSLVCFHVLSGNQLIPNATVKAMRGKEEVIESATGDGPIDAIYNAIERVTGIAVRLINYKITAITSGKDALGEVTVIVEHKKQRYTGHGSSTDIIEASAKAYLSATNRIILARELGSAKKKRG